MATLLDVGILSHFGSLFVIILLFAIVYGILEATNPFGKGKKGIHAIVAITIAFLFLISRLASAMIQVMVPWFIIVMVFIFFVMLLFRMFNVDDKAFREVIGNGSVFPWIIIFSLLVLFGALSTVFGQSLLEAGGSGNTPVVVSPDTGAQVGNIPPGALTTSSTATNSFTVNFLNTVRNPKILGLLFVFLTGAFLMIFLTKPIGAD